MANVIKTVDVKSAIDIFDQSRSENDNFLIEQFSGITNIDAGSINKSALVSKLYRYKTKLKGKRENVKADFEKETFSVPVATLQAPVKGKIFDEEIASYAEACSGLASELLAEKKKSKKEIQSLKEEHINQIQNLQSTLEKEVKIVKRTHSEELQRETKKVKLVKKKSSKQLLSESFIRDKIEQQLQSALKAKKSVTNKNLLLQRQLKRYKQNKLKEKMQA